MSCLPSLVFRSKVKAARVLQIRWEHNGLVPSFARKLNTQVPAVESHEREFSLVTEMLSIKVGEPIDGISEGPGVPNMFPGQGSQTRCRASVSTCVLLVHNILTAKRSNRCVNRLDKDAVSSELVEIVSTNFEPAIARG